MHLFKKDVLFHCSFAVLVLVICMYVFACLCATVLYTDC
jgi:hypothetical protein